MAMGSRVIDGLRTCDATAMASDKREPDHADSASGRSEAECGSRLQRSGRTIGRLSEAIGRPEGLWAILISPIRLERSLVELAYGYRLLVRKTEMVSGDSHLCWFITGGARKRP